VAVDPPAAALLHSASLASHLEAVALPGQRSAISCSDVDLVSREAPPYDNAIPIQAHTIEATMHGTAPEFLTSLNPQQRAAAEHGSGPLLVIAGAGTGKTKTLAARVASLIRRGTDPGRILLLTFTRRAAAEMIRRAGQVVGEAIAARVWSGTFHAIAHRLLRTHCQALGLGSSFVVMDQGDAEDLMHLIRTDLALHQNSTRFPQKGTLLAIYSRTVNAGEKLEDTLASRFPWCQNQAAGIKAVFREYMKRKQERGLLDYDDLLLYWEQALDTPGVAEAIAGRFQHVLVDEYQDTNLVQSSILRKLHAACGVADSSIMVVGDDAQAIYSFRGSTIENILRFPEQFPNTTTITLDQNYRSVGPILTASNAVMEQATRRYTKNLWSTRQGTRKPELVTCPDEVTQSSFVADAILAHREEGIGLMKQAVLFRASHNSDALEVELARRNIPFVKWGGLRFLEAAHIKDLLAFLRILENPRDELSWMRVLQMLDGVGPGRARQAVQHMQRTTAALDALRTWDRPPAAAEQLTTLLDLLHELAQPDRPLRTQIERIRQFYGPIFDKRYEQPEMRRRDLDQLELLAQQGRDRATFLAELTLDPPVSTGDLAGPPLLDEEYVVLSTIHSAKGCEWDVVYLIHAADGVLPSDMANSPDDLEEERRLLYVAMTRARDRLLLTWPLRYFHRKHPLGDAYSTAQLTRFVPPELFPHFERRATGNAPPSDLPLSSSGTPVAETVRARLEKLWE
jgi:DNA helicase-2/ATP-dependent DNA helicase PcrA